MKKHLLYPDYKLKLKINKLKYQKTNLGLIYGPVYEWVQ